MKCLMKYFLNRSKLRVKQMFFGAQNQFRSFKDFKVSLRKV